MAKIRFKSKVRTLRNVGGDVIAQYLAVPGLDRRHCDMPAFRVHPIYGPYANSDLFKGMLGRLGEKLFGKNRVDLDSIPDGVTVNSSGFLAEVEIDV